MTGSVVVYNLGGKEIVNRVSVQHAIKMLYKGKATLHTAVEGEYFGPFPVPQALELVRYVYAKWMYRTTGEAQYSKRGVLRRDNATCAYCGGHATTVDHVIPKHTGASLTWNNAVAACFSCNQKKGGKSPKEAGMKLRFLPRTPSFHEAYAWSHTRAD